MPKVKMVSSYCEFECEDWEAEDNKTLSGMIMSLVDVNEEKALEMINEGDIRRVVEVNCNTVKEYKEILSSLDPEKVFLSVNKIPNDVKGQKFMFEGHDFTITGADIEYNEEPVLYAMRSDAVELEGFCYDDVDDNGDSEPGYYTTDNAYGDFGTFYCSGDNMVSLTSGRRFAKNHPTITDGTIIGFYWIYLSAVMDEFI